MFLRTHFIYVVAVAIAYTSSIMATTVKDCARSYTVQQGDTCNDIGAAQNASTYQIAHANNFTINPTCTNLAVGESICLGVKGQDCKTTYVVQSGDTCNAIVTKAKIAYSTLISNNPNLPKNPDMQEDCIIYSGEVLCLADHDVYPTQS